MGSIPSVQKSWEGLIGYPSIWEVLLLDVSHGLVTVKETRSRNHRETDGRNPPTFQTERNGGGGTRSPLSMHEVVRFVISRI